MLRKIRIQSSKNCPKMLRPPTCNCFVCNVDHTMVTESVPTRQGQVTPLSFIGFVDPIVDAGDEVPAWRQARENLRPGLVSGQGYQFQDGDPFDFCPFPNGQCGFKGFLNQDLKKVEEEEEEEEETLFVANLPVRSLENGEKLPPFSKTLAIAHKSRGENRAGSSNFEPPMLTNESRLAKVKRAGRRGRLPRAKDADGKGSSRIESNIIKPGCSLLKTNVRTSSGDLKGWKRLSDETRQKASKEAKQLVHFIWRESGKLSQSSSVDIEANSISNGFFCGVSQSKAMQKTVSFRDQVRIIVPPHPLEPTESQQKQGLFHRNTLNILGHKRTNIRLV